MESWMALASIIVVVGQEVELSVAFCGGSREGPVSIVITRHEEMDRVGGARLGGSRAHRACRARMQCLCSVE
ncbi:hypothetical protein T492DRAFT_992662 [Pavlovales sp. CCMP2436]|nr:hypothetical protein T492DRAFT_992662 [Pavlovales sp. CCMP2436]